MGVSLSLPVTKNKIMNIYRNAIRRTAANETVEKLINAATFVILSAAAIIILGLQFRSIFI